MGRGVEREDVELLTQLMEGAMRGFMRDVERMRERLVEALKVRGGEGRLTLAADEAGLRGALSDVREDV